MSTEEQPGKVSDLLGYDNAAAAEAGVGLGVKSKRAAADAAGRRLKGRGADGGTQTTMGDKGDFETIPSACRSGSGPGKCANPHETRCACELAHPSTHAHVCSQPLRAGLSLSLGCTRRRRRMCDAC